MQPNLTWGNIFTGVLMWSVIMMLPVLISYFQKSNPLVSSALLTIVYPLAIAVMTRRPSFWISFPVIAGAAACSLLTWIILTSTGVTNGDVFVFVPVSAFIFGMIVLSANIDMYEQSFIKTNNGGGRGNYGIMP